MNIAGLSKRNTNNNKYNINQYNKNAPVLASWFPTWRRGLATRAAIPT